MKKLLIAMMLMCAAISASASSGEKLDKVRLRTGEVYKGKIVHRDNTKIEINDEQSGSQTFLMDEIDYVDYAMKKKNTDKTHFRGFLDLGYSLGIGSPRNNITKVETSFGYQFNHYLYIGAGIGFHFYEPDLESFPYREDRAQGVYERSDPNWRFPFIPFYLNFRSNLFSENRVTPFVDAKVGATFINHKGFFFAPAIGVHIPTRSLFSVHISVGYSMEYTSYKHWVLGTTPGAIGDTKGGYYIKNTPVFSNIDFKVGVQF